MDLHTASCLAEHMMWASQDFANRCCCSLSHHAIHAAGQHNAGPQMNVPNHQFTMRMFGCADLILVRAGQRKVSGTCQRNYMILGAEALLLEHMTHESIFSFAA